MWALTNLGCVGKVKHHVGKFQVAMDHVDFVQFTNGDDYLRDVKASVALISLLVLPKDILQTTSVHERHQEENLFLGHVDVLESAKAFGVAHLVTLRQPDSTLPVRERTEFPAIHHFEEILDGLPGID